MVEDDDLQLVLREIKILKKIRHPNIVQLYEVIYFFQLINKKYIINYKN